MNIIRFLLVVCSHLLILTFVLGSFTMYGVLYEPGFLNEALNFIIQHKIILWALAYMLLVALTVEIVFFFWKDPEE